MPWGAVIGAAVSLYGANKQAGAANAAGKAGQDAAYASQLMQQQMYDQQRADQMPFRNNGLMAQNEFMRLLGFNISTPQFSQDAAKAYLAANPDVASDPYWGQNPWLHYTQHGQGEGRAWNGQSMGGGGSGGTSAQTMQDAFAKFRSTPGYQFGLDQGFKTIQSSAAARSGLNSGATMKALQKFGNDYADQQGFTPYMNRLASLFGGAQTATNQMGAAGQNFANQSGQNMNNAANARMSAITGAADAWSQGAAGAGGALNNAYQNYKWRQMYGG